MQVVVLALAVAAHAASGVTLRVAYPGWDSPEQERAVTAAIAEFERQNPDISIEMENYPWAIYHDKLVVSLRAGTGPDLGYVISRWLPELHMMGALEDLTEFRSRLQWNDWFEASWQTGLYDGRYFAIPGRREPYVIFYNRDLFKQAGIGSFPDTMDDFVAVAKRLSTNGSRGFGLVLANHPTFPGQIINFMYAFGCGVVTPDGRESLLASPECVQAVRFYTDLYRRYQVVQASAPADSRDEVRRLFMAGKVAMMIDGLWATGTFKQLAPQLDWGIGLFPRVEGKPRRALMGGWDWVVFEQTRHRDAAFRFIEYMTRPDVMAQIEVTLPARKSALEEGKYRNPWYDPWKEALQYAYPDPKTPRYEELFQIVNQAVQSVVLQGVAVERALSAADSQARRLLGQ